LGNSVNGMLLFRNVWINGKMLEYEINAADSEALGIKGDTGNEVQPNGLITRN
jgi:hypothetical protein